MRCDQCTDKGCSKGEPCRVTDRESLYSDPFEAKLLKTSADTEALYYGTLCRLDEIMEFSRRMEFKRLGVAFCIGLATEAKFVCELLAREFEVTSVCCKVGGMPKAAFDMTERPWIGKISCNPGEQARVMNEEKTDFNIVLGLCVGHDSLFYRHSEAPVTTLVTKDRKLGHNPVAAIYCPYLNKHLGKKPKERTE